MGGVDLSATVTQAVPGYDTLDVDGTSIRVYREGTPTEGSIVYLHSASGEVCSIPFFGLLAGAGYQIVVPELPGFGGSAEPSPPWRSIEDTIFHLRRTIELLTPEPAILVGSSLGGWLAAELAVWFPERVKAMVLIGSVGLRIEGAPIFNVFGTPGIDHQTEMMNRANPHNADTFSPLFAAMADTDLPTDTAFLMHFARAMAGTARIGWNPYMHDPRLRGRLTGVKAPTLILHGADDGIVPRQHAETYASEIADATFELIPTSGHMPALDQPHVVADHVCAFLRGQQA